MGETNCGAEVKACCERFAKESGNVRAFAGGGFAYPPGFQPAAQIEFLDGTWNVNGCCGGGCYVLDSIEYCPFCGTKLEAPE